MLKFKKLLKVIDPNATVKVTVPFGFYGLTQFEGKAIDFAQFGKYEVVEVRAVGANAFKVLLLGRV